LRSDLLILRLPPLSGFGSVGLQLYLLVCTISFMDAKERLIESARELLWERGYVGMSPKAIQDRASVGQGSMYHHFAGKEALALAAIERSTEKLYQAAEEDFASPHTAIERISAYLQRERKVLRGCRAGKLTQDPDVVANPKLRYPLEKMFTRLQQRAARVLEEGKMTGELEPTMNARDIAATIIAVLQGGYVLARAENSAEPFDRAIRGILFLLGAQASPVRPKRKGSQTGS
jgi:TetR/AcrR family transcriptional regulator, transcriptional repressor for nem operon